MDDKERAKQILLEIIRQSSGDEITGKVRFFKAFYFAHLFYAEDNANFLSEWPIVKMPLGPGIDRFDLLMQEMAEEGVVEVTPFRDGPFPSTKFTLTDKGRRSENPEPEVIDAIRKTVAFVSHKSSQELSDLTHEYSRSWNNASDGDVLPVYLDLLEDEAYQEVMERDSRIANQLKAAWE